MLMHANTNRHVDTASAVLVFTAILIVFPSLTQTDKSLKPQGTIQFSLVHTEWD